MIGTEADFPAPEVQGRFQATPRNMLADLPLDKLFTPRVNDETYGRTVETDPGIIRLAEGIAEDGVLQPLLVNREGAIMAGNRRAAAARLAGLKTVPCIVRDVKEGTAHFNRLLAAANYHNREKTLSQTAREAALMADPEEARKLMIAQRKAARERTAARSMEIMPPSRRKAIVDNRPLADAAKRIILAHEWPPLTLRQVHYLLLNDPPLVNSRTGRRYRNDKNCYQTLSGVITRLRVAGELPFSCLADPNRHLTPPQWFSQSANAYLRGFIDSCGSEYRRDLMQGQGDFIAVFVEKQTQQALFEEHLVLEYPGIPLAVCRGETSISGTHAIAEAWRRSGKSRLVLVGMTDCDPAGSSIAATVGKQLFEMGMSSSNLEIIRAGLTPEQARSHGARPAPIKTNERGGVATKAAKWARKHGTDVFELESIPQEALLGILDNAIESVLDLEAFNRERDECGKDLLKIMDFKKGLAKWEDESEGPAHDH